MTLTGVRKLECTYQWLRLGSGPEGVRVCGVRFRDLARLLDRGQSQKQTPSALRFRPCSSGELPRPHFMENP